MEQLNLFNTNDYRSSRDSCFDWELDVLSVEFLPPPDQQVEEETTNPDSQITSSPLADQTQKTSAEPHPVPAETSPINVGMLPAGKPLLGDKIDLREKFTKGDRLIHGGHEGVVEGVGVRFLKVLWSRGELARYSPLEVELLRLSREPVGCGSPGDSSPTDLGYKNEGVYPKTPDDSSPPDLGYKNEDMYPKSGESCDRSDLAQTIARLNLSNPQSNLLEVLLEISADLTSDEIEFAIAFFQSLGQTPCGFQPNVIEEEKSKGAIELKTIGGYGPYAYRRVWDGKRHRSQYLGRVSESSFSYATTGDKSAGAK